MSRARPRTTTRAIMLQREVDGRRAIGMETLRERVVSVGVAHTAVQHEEEGAQPALVQALVDLSSAALQLAEQLKPR